jgi:hypothetical protein
MEDTRPRGKGALVAGITPRQALLALAALTLATAPALGATASQAPAPISPDAGATQFFNYDFTSPSVGAANHSWPVTLVFAGNASVSKVKLALGRSFPWPGSFEYGLVAQGGRWWWDADAGRKTRLCSVLRPSNHYRLYAPPLAGRLLSPVLGGYVVGTTHQDRGECGPYSVAGWSEDAEAAVAGAARALNWQVEEDALPLGNAEVPPRWEGAPTGPYPGNHYWDNNGWATVIHVP